MAENFELTPEDRLLWEQRFPRAGYWVGVHNSHPGINNGRPIEPTPPPPYTGPALPPMPPAPAMPPYLGNNQPILGNIHPGAMIPLPPVNPVPIYDIRYHPGAMIPLPPIDPVPIYDIHRHANARSVSIPRDARSSIPPRKLKFGLVHEAAVKNILI